MRQIAYLINSKGLVAKKDKRVDNLRLFFETFVLGIITQFSDVVYDMRGRQPILEKRRNIRAIEEMITLGNMGVSSALPQVGIHTRAL